MSADPDPNKVVIIFDREGTVTSPNSNRPVGTCFLKPERGMSRIHFEEIKVAPGSPLD